VRETAPDALVVVDGVHGYGVEATTAAALGCDVLVSGCHKWLMGPRGTGIVWAGARAWKRIRPVIPSFEGGRAPGPVHSPGGFHDFEHRWALAEAYAFHRAIGARRIEARVHALARRLRSGLAALPNVRMVTPPAPLMAGLVVFDVAGTSADAAVGELHAAGVLATVPPYAERHVRLGASITLSPADVDAAVRAVRAL